MNTFFRLHIRYTVIKISLLVCCCSLLVAASEASHLTKRASQQEVASAKNPEERQAADNKAQPEEKKETNHKKDGDKKEGPKKGFLSFSPADSDFQFGIKLRLPEFFYGKNLRLINDNNPTDTVLHFRHTIDFNAEYRYGRPTAKYDLVYVKMTLRNKGVWGDPESIASTTSSTIKEIDAVFGDHRHGIPRHIIWIRELWIHLSLSDILGLPFCNRHTLTFGAFPFELGRGIALGTAFATDPTDLGYFSENAIDQYAFGAKLSGEIVKDKLIYDVYGAILDNKSSTFDAVNMKIRGQQFGHRHDQARGFGVINYIIAARLKWTPVFDNTKAFARFEPYGLFNHAPEQKIEFIGDAKSDLFTLGLAGEFEWGDFECGFDTAFNFGRQTVFGWDRNIIKPDNIEGNVVSVNSSVRQAPPGETPSQKSPLALKTAENQRIINQSTRAASENGKIIFPGTDTVGALINDRDRFTDPYINKFRGMMLVYDMGYYVCKPDVKVAAGFGFASGDANPNKDEEIRGDSEMDGEYEGFIGLQESYAGLRVKSAFLLSGSGKIPRPLSFPTEEVLDPFASTVSRFTNLVFVGTSAYWRPSWSCRKWSFNPNVLAYWSDFSSPFFDARSQQNLVNRFARDFLGVEANIFLEAELLPDLRFFTVAAIFFPGSHYRDIKGRPLTRAQKSFIDNLDKTGIVNDRVPLLGTDKSYFVTLGFEYRF